jgi:hypothetical protein
LGKIRKKKAVLIIHLNSTMETNSQSDLNPEEAINSRDENITGQSTPDESKTDAQTDENPTHAENESDQSLNDPARGIELVKEATESMADEGSAPDEPEAETPQSYPLSADTEDSTTATSETYEDSSKYSASSTPDSVVEENPVPEGDQSPMAEVLPSEQHPSEDNPDSSYADKAEDVAEDAGITMIDEAVETLKDKEGKDITISEEPMGTATIEEQPDIIPGTEKEEESASEPAITPSPLPQEEQIPVDTKGSDDEENKSSDEIQVVPGLLAQQALSLNDEDEEESDDSEEDEEAEDETSYTEMSRLQLVEKLEELVKDPDINKIKGDVGQIKMAFLKLNKEFKHEAYQKLAEQNEEIDTENIDSSDAQHLIADDDIEIRYKEAFGIYRKGRAAFNEQLEKEKAANLEEKNKILDELKMLIASEETLKKTYDEFKNLQEKWKTIGMVPKGEVNTLWQNYHFLVEKFFDKVKINKELKDLDLKKNLEAKMLLCEKAEELLLEKSITKSFKQLQQYHEDWKEIGPVPQDKKDEIWERFRAATDQINERRHEYYAQMQTNFEQNLAAKKILCEKAEQLLQVENDSIKSWQDTTNKITELLQLWKSLGPAPKKQNNEIWNRFKASLDSFFNAKKEYYSNLKEQQLHNFNVKLDLCVQAEALRNSTNWKSTTRDLINLQNEWKKVGPVPRKQSDRIWKRFRAACDEFFKAKNEYFSNIQSHEGENLKLKLELIDKVKGFEVGDDRNQAIETLKSFQRQWMDIGFVPIKEKERLQTEFRSLINKHFEKLKMDSMTSGANNYLNRIDRMTKDSQDAGRVISKERGFLQGKIQQLQDDIKLWENNIGFFANSKTANLLKQEFEKKIDQAKDELQMLESKMKALREAGN